MSRKKTDVLYNHLIPNQQIVLLDEDGKFLGNMETKQALEIAISRGYDLVAQSAKGESIICKIANLNKFLYEKKKSTNLSKQASTIVKDIQLKFGIHEHDINIKVNRCREFLSQKHPVNIVVRIRKKDTKVIDNIDKANQLLTMCQDKLSDIGNVTKTQLITSEQLSGSMMISPKKAA